MYITKIANNLYQGSRLNLEALKKLKNDGVTTIFDVGSSRLRDKPTKIKEKFFCFMLGLKYKEKPSTLVGKFPDKDYFITLASEVKNNNGASFIHCRSGLHRTNFAIQAVEIINAHKSIHSAIKDIKERNYFTFKKNTLFKIKNFLGLISTQKVQLNLCKRLEAFQKMFSE